jgi:hypothetical protein
MSNITNQSLAGLLKQRKSGLPPPPPPQDAPPFTPAFGSLTELFYEARDTWKDIREGYRELLPRLNAYIEAIVMFGGVPSDTMRAAEIPHLEDLLIKYERQYMKEMNDILNGAPNQAEREDRLAAIRDEFLFQGLTEMLLAVKEFLSNNNLLHEELITVRRIQGLTFYQS